MQLPKDCIFVNKTVEDSKFRGTSNHSPSVNISVDGTVQNVLDWWVGVRTVLGLSIAQKVAANFIKPPLIPIKSHPDMQKIRIIGFFFESRLHWQFEVLLLQFTVCTRV
jgi:hypothetical protein